METKTKAAYDKIQAHFAVTVAGLSTAEYATICDEMSDDMMARYEAACEELRAEPGGDDNV